MNSRQKLADIRIELRTVPKVTPEMQPSERAHRTITSYSYSRAILKQSRLPKTHWPKSVINAVFLINNTPATSAKIIPNKQYGQPHRNVNS
eukprot:Pgem_evm1s17819